MTRKPPAALERPHVRLAGEVNAAMLDRFLDQLTAARDPDPVVVEVSTLGGDAEMGRRLALELRSLRARGRVVLFLGKTMVYSSGVTIMAAVPAAERWLTPDTLLLVHGRKIQRSLELDGNLYDAEEAARRLLAEVSASLAVQQAGFAELVEGSRLTLAELEQRARNDWYLTAAEAVTTGLAAGLYDPNREARTGATARRRA